MSAATHATATEATNDQLRADAQRYEHQGRAFRLHVSVFAGSMVIIFLVNLAINAAAGITGEWWAWWSAFALVGWILGLTIHGTVVRMARPHNLRALWATPRSTRSVGEEI